MKLNTINVQIVKNIGNYESVRLGGDWSVAEGESLSAAIVEANKQLNEAFVAMMNKPAEQPTATTEQPTATTVQPTSAAELAPDGTPKKLLEFGTPTLQAICNKIAKENTDISVVEQWFTFDDKVRNVLILAKTIG